MGATRRFGWVLLVVLVACGGSDDGPPAALGSDDGQPGPLGEAAPDDSEELGGNSGSEGGRPQTGGPGNDAVSCPCNAPGDLARVRVLSREDDEVVLRLEALLHTEQDSALVEGAEVSARYLGRLPCYRGVGSVDAGDQALALFSAGEMVSPTRWAEVRLTRWEDELLFAQTDEAELRVPADALDELFGNDACVDEFGNWSYLAGEASDGASDRYYCVDEGVEHPCTDPGDDAGDEAHDAPPAGTEPADEPAPRGTGEPGEACIPEQQPQDGFAASEVYVESWSAQCAGVCLVWHLDGRAEDVEAGELAARVYCSCRCDGPSDFADSFCECPDGMSCTAPLEQGSAAVRGSYCVKPAR